MRAFRRGCMRACGIVERAQADGAARALGDEFGEHVVSRVEHDSALERTLGEIARTRTELNAKIDAKIDAIEGKLDLMIRAGGLGLAFLALIVAIAGVAIYRSPVPPPPQPPVQLVLPAWPVPAPAVEAGTAGHGPDGAPVPESHAP